MVHIFVISLIHILYINRAICQSPNIKVMNNRHSKLNFFKAIHYQKGNEFTRWHCRHISISHNVYEVAIDLRKVLKLSVSFIIANAIVEYLDEIIQNLTKNIKNTDNYSHNYVFIFNNYDGVYSFTIFWGLPPKKILKNLIT
jgi:hypothetical protein